MYPQYMCILLYVKLIWCNGIPLIYCRMEWGERLSSVYFHFALGETYLVFLYSIDLLSIRMGGTCIISICVFCYM